MFIFFSLLGHWKFDGIGDDGDDNNNNNNNNNNNDNNDNKNSNNSNLFCAKSYANA